MSTPVTIQFTVNGKPREVLSPPERPLLEVLREDLALTGTKYGCGEMQCGACSVLVDGRRQFSCRMPVSSAAGKAVRTIEGLAKQNAGDQGGAESLHPVQQAFLDEAGFQCGYCTCGMIMTAVELLEKTPAPDDAQIAAAMNRNLCRCCAYPNIIAAVRKAATIAEGSRKSSREIE
ncbi:MAG: (2Fe-2S)-binding protein [Verrucomicrobiales bacterium]